MECGRTRESPGLELGSFAQNSLHRNWVRSRKFRLSEARVGRQSPVLIGEILTTGIGLGSFAQFVTRSLHEIGFVRAIRVTSKLGSFAQFLASGGRQPPVLRSFKDYPSKIGFVRALLIELEIGFVRAIPC